MNRENVLKYDQFDTNKIEVRWHDVGEPPGKETFLQDPGGQRILDPAT